MPRRTRHGKLFKMQLMDISDLVGVVAREWDAVSAHREAFLATLAIGLAVGWTAAWLILKNRLSHHKELLEHYKDVIAEKIPALQQARATVLSIRKMLGGVALLLLVIIGPLYIILLSSKPTQNEHARLEFSGIRSEKASDNSGYKIYYNFINKGPIAAIAPVGGCQPVAAVT